MPAVIMRTLYYIVFPGALLALEEQQADGSCPAGGCRKTVAEMWKTPRNHYWPRAKGHIGSYAQTELLGPSNLSKVAWQWEHPTMAISSGMALIDYEKNILFGTMDGIHKFSPDGQLLWFWKATYAYHHSVGCIVGDVIFTGGMVGNVWALDLATGEELWRAKTGDAQEMDTPYVEMHDGVVLSAIDKKESAKSKWSGNTGIYALNASTGEKLWSYKNDETLWNFLPMFPGDGTFVVMDTTGGVLKMNIADGALRWYTRAPDPFNVHSFTDGGVILGPDKTLYTCACAGYGFIHGHIGVMRAYNHQDGSQLWEQFLPYPCVSWPASDGKTVIVPVGRLPDSSPPSAHVPEIFRRLIHTFSVWLGPKQNWLWRHEPRPMAVLAYDAVTGMPKWQFHDIPVWTFFASRGDEEHYYQRRDWEYRPVCGPASWSTGTISGDGTWYGAAMNGIIYALSDKNGDGRILGQNEVSTLDIGHASLHAGASFAPGIMAFGSCGGLTVWKT